MMTSVGVQADMTDPEGILGVIKTFHTQLQELVQLNTSLLELTSSRSHSIQQSEAIVQDLEDKIQTLVQSAAHMETMLRENQHSVEDNDKILEELTNRKEHLDTEIRNLEMQIQSTDSRDIDNEERMKGFSIEELYRKMDTLSLLHHRLDRANQDKQEEWEQFKADCLSHQEALRSYLEMKDHLDELILARYIGMQSVKGADQSERDLAERLCEHHWNKIQFRQLQQQLMQSQIKEKDLEDEIGALFTKKRDLWRRCLELENCLDELKGSPKESNGLRPSPAYSDIPTVAEGRHNADCDSDEDEESDIDLPIMTTCHGKILHRCPKSIDISIGKVLDSEVTVEENVQELRILDAIVSKQEAVQDSDIAAELEVTAANQPSDTDEVPDEAHANVPENEPESETAAEEPDTSESGNLPRRHTDVGEAGPASSSSLITKIRRRMGIGPHSSSVKIKTAKLTQSRSERGFPSKGIIRRRR